jgi:hypothetical protein
MALDCEDGYSVDGLMFRIASRIIPVMRVDAFISAEMVRLKPWSKVLAKTIPFRRVQHVACMKLLLLCIPRCVPPDLGTIPLLSWPVSQKTLAQVVEPSLEFSYVKVSYMCAHREHRR